jgi:hypothetical protein
MTKLVVRLLDKDAAASSTAWLGLSAIVALKELPNLFSL